MLFYLWKYLVECYLDAFCLCFKCLEFSLWKKIKLKTVLISSISILLKICRVILCDLGGGNPYNYHNIESDTMWYRIEIYKSNESTSYPKFRTMSKVLEEYTLFLNFSKKIWKRKQRKYSIRKWGKMQFYLLFEWYEKTYTCSELQLLRILSIDLKLKIKSIIPSN